MSKTTIQALEDIKHLSPSELQALANDIREAIISRVSAVGGHLGANLGAVELTVALHATFNSPYDKLIFDVSHQSYAHKILTGRASAFLNPAHYKDVSGFSSPQESPHDIFTVGHTSTSISLGVGLALARDAAHETYHVISVIGDGSLSGGEAFEGLDIAATLKSPLIIVVNDNNASIAENHGGIYSSLKALRQSEGTSACNPFKLLGLEYLFVKEGHNIQALLNAFRQAKAAEKPIVVHVVTEKGCGFLPAQENTELWHSTTPFALENPQSHTWDVSEYAELFADYMLTRMKTDEKLKVVCSATPLAIGFTPEKRQAAQKQYIDVGIAEQSAASICAGLARGDSHPIWGVQSTFLGRAYDQIAQDWALDSLPATLVVFGGSVYATHDKTHQGRLDISILVNIPNFVYLAPYSKEQTLSALDWACTQSKHPCGIKLPGVLVEEGAPFNYDWEALNTFFVTHAGSKVALLGLGTFYGLACDVAHMLAEEGIDATVINPLYASGVDTKLLDSLVNNHELFVTIEDGTIEGGFGAKIAQYVAKFGKQVMNYGLDKTYQERYNVAAELRRNSLTAPQITEDILSVL